MLRIIRAYNLTIVMPECINRTSITPDRVIGGYMLDSRLKPAGMAVFAFFVLMLSACGTSTIHSQKVKEYRDYEVFEAPYTEVWGAAISSIDSLSVPWELEFLDKNSGTIKFKDSYLYSDVLGNYHYRRYYKPALSHGIDRTGHYLKAYLYALGDFKLPGLVWFTEESMTIRVRPITENKTLVAVDYLSYPTRAHPSSQIELFILNSIKNNLIERAKSNKVSRSHTSEL